MDEFLPLHVFGKIGKKSPCENNPLYSSCLLGKEFSSDVAPGPLLHPPKHPSLVLDVHPELAAEVLLHHRIRLGHQLHHVLCRHHKVTLHIRPVGGLVLGGGGGGRWRGGNSSPLLWQQLQRHALG